MNHELCSTTTMTSREIASLTGKRHDNVLADCRKLSEFYAEAYSPEKAGELVKTAAYVDSSGRSVPCFYLTRDASLDLITGYSLPHRHAVNQRWMELEAKHRQPDLSREQILVMALESERERMRLEQELSAARPKIEFHDEIAQGDGEFTITETCGVVFNRAVKHAALKGWLVKNGWLVRDGSRPTAWTMDGGLMRLRTDYIEAARKTVLTPVFTGRGLTLMRHLYRTGELFTADIPRVALMPPASDTAP